MILLSYGVLVCMTAAAGSVWNKNSWHWEEKDYRKIATEKLCDLLMQVEIPNFEKISKVVPTGFASVSVRKGKRVVVFEFALSLQFGENSSVRIPEFSNDEPAPVFRVDSPTLTRSDCAKFIQPALNAFIEFMDSVESSETALARDKERREAELGKTEKAQLEKGAEKEAIALKIKQEESATRTNTGTGGSVWNANSYHWETRKLDKWAHAWIIDQLAPENVCVSGECESSIRKGKKICLFNLKIEGQVDSISFVAHFSNEEGEVAWKVVPPTVEEKLKQLVFDPFVIRLQEQ